MLIHEKRALPVFAVAVSLGGDCVPAYHICHHSIPTINGPFDHTITPTCGLIAILQQDFEGYLDPSMLHEIIVDSIIRYVMDRRYGCMFLHDFKPRTSIDCPDVRAKFDRKIRNFREALSSTEPVLLVRRHCGRGDAERLAYVLNRFYPRLQWHLLAMNNHQEPDWGLGRVTNWYMDHSIAFPGDYLAWSWALSQFTFKSQLNKTTNLEQDGVSFFSELDRLNSM